MELLQIGEEQIDNAFIDIYIQGYELHRSMYPDVFRKVEKNDYKKEIASEFLSHNLVYKIMNGNTLIGIFTAYPTISDNLTTFFLEKLVIDKKQQGKNHFTEIIKKIQEEAKKYGCKAIDLNCWAKNKHAIDIYKHLGFEERNIRFRYNIIK